MFDSVNPTTDTTVTARFPVETWHSIFWNLTSPGDLYNVSITSRYLYDIVNPILYRVIVLDPNHYSTYTLSLLKRHPVLAHRVTELTLLRSVYRHIPTSIRVESEALYRSLDIPYAPTWFPVPQAEVKMCTLPILHFVPSFTALTTLRITNDFVPSDFLHRMFELPQLTTLDIEDSTIAADLQKTTPPTPLPLRTLSITRCLTLGYYTEIIRNICNPLLRNAPFLTSLTIDGLIHPVACRTISEMDTPPPIQSLSFYASACRYSDPDCSVFRALVSFLPTIRTLTIYDAPPDFFLSQHKDHLPCLNNLTAKLQTIMEFSRPVEFLTIIDAPETNQLEHWEGKLIRAFLMLHNRGQDPKGLAFNISEWNEELFRCICQLWPGLKELRIQCTSGERTSFGTQFLPQLGHLEVLHIYGSTIQHNFVRGRMSKGVAVVTHSPLTDLSPDESKELAVDRGLRSMWGKICPSLREVAFDQAIWWRRVASKGGEWALMREFIPTIREE